jgi:hypothetical protein
MMAIAATLKTDRLSTIFHPPASQFDPVLTEVLKTRSAFYSCGDVPAFSGSKENGQLKLFQANVIVPTTSPGLSVAEVCSLEIKRDFV